MALGAIAAYTLLERNFLGIVQLRKGPQKVGPWGLLQPVADAIKLLRKNIIIPRNANQAPFLAAPVVGLTIALLGWTVIPYSYNILWFKYGSFLIITLSRLSVYPVIIAGWASNSKYSLLGAIRRVAQTISYEVSMSFLFIRLTLIFRSINLGTMYHTHFIPICILPPIAAIWVVTVLAETNRSPFDLAEGERELVSGYNVEYSSWGFTFLFMAEYLSILILRAFSSIILLPGIGLFTPLKILLFSLIFLVTRAALPRIRYDQLMKITWKSFLPVSIWGIIIRLAIKLVCSIISTSPFHGESENPPD